jgi:hypothetical protein
MRFLMKVAMPDEPFNNFVKDGSAGTKVQQILEDLKPEAAYFVEMNGHRTGILIINMDNTAQMPALAEPWFLLFNAEVEFHPAMVPEDLAHAGLEAIGKKWN